MTKEQLMSYPVNSNSLISKNGGPWKPLFYYPELMEMLKNRKFTGSQSVNESKRIVCGILAILLGWLGIQYFIIGKNAGGFITIGLSIITFGLWSLIMFIQGIMMLTMSDMEFESKFVHSPSTLPIF